MTIGVLCNSSEREIVQEFFELFKTPWEFYNAGQKYEVVISSLTDHQLIDATLLILYNSLSSNFDGANGLSVELSSSRTFTCPNGMEIPIYGKLASVKTVRNPTSKNEVDNDNFVIQVSDQAQQRLRVGYDLFQEISFLLTLGQPAQYSLIPTIDIHISLLREWILGFGLPLVEIPPIPYGYRFIACLTHDVDFVGIRRHIFDHTMWGFVYRGTVGPILDLLRGKGDFTRIKKNLLAVLSLPFIYLGLADDYWEHFDNYAELEKGLSSTFFIIPFKHRAGDLVESNHYTRRATAYDVSDVKKQVKSLLDNNFEIGLHGIDAWNSLEKGNLELRRIIEATGNSAVGVRIHWLLFNETSPAILEQAGFDYDTSVGYNETVGFKAGTTQVYKPFTTHKLLELPLHIQDTALFFPRRMGLSVSQAWNYLKRVIDNSIQFGGVLTLCWHERSLAPERLWGDIYQQLLNEFHSLGVWISSAREAIQWFRQRRSIQFEYSNFVNGVLHLELRFEGQLSEPRMVLRVYKPTTGRTYKPCKGETFVDFPYNGESSFDIS